MAAAEGSRKLLCACGKPLALFDAKGLNLYCCFSKETTTVPYGIAGLPEAMAFVHKPKPTSRGAGNTRTSSRMGMRSLVVCVSMATSEK